MVIDRQRALFWSAIIEIILNVCNLIEQLIIYSIVRQESSGDHHEQRMFFFVLVIIGLLSNLPSISPYLYIQTVGSISIEVGELFAYLFLLDHSTNVLLVVFLSFALEFLLHAVHIFLEYNSRSTDDKVFIFAQSTCGRVKYVLLRSISYCIFDATSILFLFLDRRSRFHNRFYEILILLTFYFPSIALGPAMESISKFTWEYDQGRVPQLTIPLAWSLFCATVYFIMYSIPLSITGIVFAIQELRDMAQSSARAYDFIVYVTSMTFFGISIVVFPPFMVWWWRFTVRRFQKMTIDARYRLAQPETIDSMHQCL